MRKHGNGLRSSGEKIIVQYALGTEDAPYSDQSILLGTDDTLAGTDLALVGVDNSGIWQSSPPTPAKGQYVWRDGNILKIKI